MVKDPQRQHQDNVISTLNLAIEGLNLTKEILSITPAKAICGSVTVVLAMIRVRLSLVRVDHRCGLIERYLGFDDKRDGLRRAWARLR